MKRGTLRHPKVDHLMSLLQQPRWGVGGILESLWQFTAGYSPRGDVGRFSDAEIATALDWRSDPGELVRALLTARWLDGCRCHRVRVHDWPDHADQTVHRREEVKRHGFIDCYDEPDASGQLAESPSSGLAVNASQPWPLPAPAPEPAPSPRPAPVPEPATKPTPDEAAWNRVLAQLARQLPEHVYSTWFQPTRGIAGETGELRVLVPSAQFRTWIARNYRQQLDKAMTAAGVGKLRLTLVPPERPP